MKNGPLPPEVLDAEQQTALADDAVARKLQAGQELAGSALQREMEGAIPVDVPPEEIARLLGVPEEQLPPLTGFERKVIALVKAAPQPADGSGVNVGDIAKAGGVSKQAVSEYLRRIREKLEAAQIDAQFTIARPKGKRKGYRRHQLSETDQATIETAIIKGDAALHVIARQLDVPFRSVALVYQSLIDAGKIQPRKLLDAQKLTERRERVQILRVVQRLGNAAIVKLLEGASLGSTDWDLQRLKQETDDPEVRAALSLRDKGSAAAVKAFNLEVQNILTDPNQPHPILSQEIAATIARRRGLELDAQQLQRLVYQVRNARRRIYAEHPELRATAQLGGRIPEVTKMILGLIDHSTDEIQQALAERGVHVTKRQIYNARYRYRKR